ncbi:MAG: hypothetical protein K0U34_09155, partial [Alphaproteobacteria bacterium]|nr:hypothetical protein [Alphaproteobacteria bacterium]
MALVIVRHPRNLLDQAQPMPHLFVFGFGFTARALAGQLSARNWRITGTSRTREGAAAIRALGHDGLVFFGEDISPDIHDALAAATHVLISNPPSPVGDQALSFLAPLISNTSHQACPQLKWIGYLST